MSVAEDYKDGRDSGFSVCCIFFYVFRLWVWKKTGKFIDNPTEVKGACHILCPMHYLVHLAVPIKDYYFCETCNWQQYDLKTCTKCLNCRHQFPYDEAKCIKCDYLRNPICVDLAVDENGDEVAEKYGYERIE
jgi:hypothetical protein